MANLLATKPLNTILSESQETGEHSLKRVLGVNNLIALGIGAIIGTGIMWSVSEHGTGVRKMSSLAFGGSCALGATQLMTTLFPLGGALF